MVILIAVVSLTLSPGIQKFPINDISCCRW